MSDAARVREVMLPDTASEDELLRWCVALAGAHGWLVHHSLARVPQERARVDTPHGR